MATQVKRRQIRSKNELFRGELVDKPLKAKVVGEDEDGCEIYRCPNCGNEETAENCDCGGAEPYGLFCNQCHREFSTW